MNLTKCLKRRRAVFKDFFLTSEKKILNLFIYYRYLQKINNTNYG